MKRKIIEIEDEKCNGCGVCIPNCPEGAIQIIDGKARLVSDLYCDGLGACIGHCPTDAIRIIEREAEPYDEKKVMERIVRQGRNVIKAHLEHLKEHNEGEFLKQAEEYLRENNISNPLEVKASNNRSAALQQFHSCPGSQTLDFSRKRSAKSNAPKQQSELRQWPVQLTLVPPDAGFFQNSDLLVAADCVPFANANFHPELLKGKSLVIGCPKLDDIEMYREKLTAMLKQNSIKSVTVAIMEVPCCNGLYHAVDEAIRESGKNIELEKVIIPIQ